MASIYERFGRLQEKYEAEIEAHHATIRLIQRLQSCEIALEQVVIGHNADGTVSWHVMPKPEKTPAGGPATLDASQAA